MRPSVTIDRSPGVADAATGCLNGTIRTAAGELAAGITLDVSGPGGELTAS